jgi:hypothetical protein
MSKALHGTVALGAMAAVLLLALPAGAGTVKTTPVKGATYSGVVHGMTLTVKVDRKGRTATVSLPEAPGFCQGGSGPEVHHTKPAAVGHDGALTATITYTTGGEHPTKIATVTVTGHFFTFSGSSPVFDGQVKSKFAAKGNASCNGQESFEALER